MLISTVETLESYGVADGGQDEDSPGGQLVGRRLQIASVHTQSALPPARSCSCSCGCFTCGGTCGCLRC